MRHKKRVWWAPQQSAGDQEMVLAPTFAGGTSGMSYQEIIADDIDEAASESGAPANMGRFGGVEDVVVKRIVGKVPFIWDNILLQAEAPGSGLLGMFVRMGITKVMRNPDGTLASTMTDNLWSLDPASAGAPVKAGSGGPRWIWRRDFFVGSAFYLAINAKEVVSYNSELFCPPGPYVDIQPNCHIRQNERIMFAVQCNLSNSISGGDSTGSQSLIRVRPSLKALLTKGVR